MSHTNTVNRQRSTVNQIAICASGAQRSQLLRSPVFQMHELIFAEGIETLAGLKADAYFDLLFEEEYDQPVEKSGSHSAILPARREAQKKRIESLSALLPAPVFINSVIQPLSLLHPDFIRINGWPGFLEMPLLEAAANKNSETKARAVFGDQIQIVKDVPGFVTPRILSMIINEAYFTLHSGASTSNEIDIAMKLGTGYPLGPFEWAEKIGIHRVAALLTALGGEEGEVYGLAPGMVDG